MTTRNKDSLVLAVMGAMFVIIFGVWQIDEHFVTRREFNELRREVSAIRQYFGIPKPAPPAPGDQ